MAASQPQSPNIWAQMNYTPPRGPCSQKTSLVSTCSCYRFMIHPLKASSSFNCDGCGHHASFHKMDNGMDEEIVRRWKTEETERDQQHRQYFGMLEGYKEIIGSGTGAKRRRIENRDDRGRRIENEDGEGMDEGEVVDAAEVAIREVTQVGRGRRKGNGKRGG